MVNVWIDEIDSFHGGAGDKTRQTFLLMNTSKANHVHTYSWTTS